MVRALTLGRSSKLKMTFSNFSRKLMSSLVLKNLTLAWPHQHSGIWLQISRHSRVNSLYRLPDITTCFGNLCL
uniref:Proteasome 26S subunit, ATPase 2 n=1 Tax=Homo sapiens TaxID=9606 RepID=A0A7I2YQ68_HUMAN